MQKQFSPSDSTRGGACSSTHSCLAEPLCCLFKKAFSPAWLSLPIYSILLSLFYAGRCRQSSKAWVLHQGDIVLDSFWTALCGSSRSGLTTCSRPCSLCSHLKPAIPFLLLQESFNLCCQFSYCAAQLSSGWNAWATALQQRCTTVQPHCHLMNKHICTWFLSMVKRWSHLHWSCRIDQNITSQYIDFSYWVQQHQKKKKKNQIMWAVLGGWKLLRI